MFAPELNRNRTEKRESEPELNTIKFWFDTLVSGAFGNKENEKAVL